MPNTSQPNAVEKRLKGDFKVFLSVLWNSIGLPKPTRAQLAMADYLQNGPKRLQLSCFRGVGKSYVTAAFVLWELFRDKDKKILIISASKDRADANALFLQKLILDVPWLQFMAPTDDNQRWSRVSFDINGCTPPQAPPGPGSPKNPVWGGAASIRAAASIGAVYVRTSFLFWP